MNKPFVFKARIKVADLFHHSHHEEVFTTAMLSKESSEHFAMKLLGICALSFDKPAKWSKTEKKYWPDVWLEDENEQIEVALFIGTYEVEEILKYEKLYTKVVVLCADGEQWFEERRVQLQFIGSLSVFSIPAVFVADLCEMLTRSLHWDVILENGALSITDNEHYIRAQITKLI